jgi:hypothetical protein
MLYAAAATANEVWRQSWSRFAVVPPLATAGVLVGLWVRQILIIDSSRIADLVKSLG